MHYFWGGEPGLSEWLQEEFFLPMRDIPDDLLYIDYDLLHSKSEYRFLPKNSLRLYRNVISSDNRFTNFALFYETTSQTSFAVSHNSYLADLDFIYNLHHDPLNNSTLHIAGGLARQEYIKQHFDNYSDSDWVLYHNCHYINYYNVSTFFSEVHQNIFDFESSCQRSVLS